MFAWLGKLGEYCLIAMLLKYMGMMGYRGTLGPYNLFLRHLLKIVEMLDINSYRETAVRTLTGYTLYIETIDLEGLC